jgi:hypothetical protein
MLLPSCDVAYRALLRNLRLLAGQRTKPRLAVVIAGFESRELGERLRLLEPSLDIVAVPTLGKRSRRE